MGTDLSTTTDIPLALSKGLTVSLAPDWTMSGSQNVLDELRFAKMVSDVRWAGQITPKMLTEMVTINAAKNIGLSGELGSLEVGKRADIMVITGDPSQPYESLINARPTNVRLVLVDGVPLYGDANLQPTAPASPGCELLDLCTCSKFLCVAVNGGTPAQLLGQTFAQIRQNLITELGTYDANGWPNVSGPPSVPLSPISPLYRCPQ